MNFAARAGSITTTTPRPAEEVVKCKRFAPCIGSLTDDQVSLVPGLREAMNYPAS